MADELHDISRVAEIDRLVAKGNIHRMRSEFLQAEDAYREALALDESRADIAELVADMLYARGQIDSSAEAYKQLIEKRPAVETKYARVVLEIGEREHQKEMARYVLENPGTYSGPPKRPVLSMLMSALAPGFGQIYNGEIVKGAIILGVFFLSLLVLAMAPLDVENLLKMLGRITRPEPGVMPAVSPIVILFASVNVFVWIYAVIDAPISADKLRSKEDKLGR